ncbi:MAG: hypothetical protein VKO64_06170 [Candidatus Sericytochromatia bacterium]|nr:hypothetical protein [Candidatus Sericytochromatia bacterium]
MTEEILTGSPIRDAALLRLMVIERIRTATTPDRAAAEAAMRALCDYLAEPCPVVLWFPSPLMAAMAHGLLREMTRRGEAWSRHVVAMAAAEVRGPVACPPELAALLPGSLPSTGWRDLGEELWGPAASEDAAHALSPEVWRGVWKRLATELWHQAWDAGRTLPEPGPFVGGWQALELDHRLRRLERRVRDLLGGESGNPRDGVHRLVWQHLTEFVGAASGDVLWPEPAEAMGHVTMPHAWAWLDIVTEAELSAEPEAQHLLGILRVLSRAGTWRIACKHVWFMADPPCQISLEPGHEAALLHAERDAALRYADGHVLHAWFGERVHPRFANLPARMTWEDVVGEREVARQRAMLGMLQPSEWRRATVREGVGWHEPARGRCQVLEVKPPGHSGRPWNVLETARPGSGLRQRIRLPGDLMEARAIREWLLGPDGENDPEGAEEAAAAVPMSADNHEEVRTMGQESTRKRRGRLEAAVRQAVAAAMQDPVRERHSIGESEQERDMLIHRIIEGLRDPAKRHDDRLAELLGRLIRITGPDINCYPGLPGTACHRECWLFSIVPLHGEPESDACMRFPDLLRILRDHADKCRNTRRFIVVTEEWSARAWHDWRDSLAVLESRGIRIEVFLWAGAELTRISTQT